MGESDATAAAELALRRLAETYALAADRRDGALLAAQFTADGELIAPRGRFVGREALAKVPDLLTERYEKTFHGILGQVPAFDGGTATAETYCIARHFYRDGTGQYLCYEMTIRYRDDFRMTEDGWRFARRDLMVDATRVFPVDERPR